MKNCDSAKVKAMYNQIKKECQSECRKAKNSFINKISEEKDSKMFWSYIKSKKKDNVSCSFLKDENGKLQGNTKDKVNILLKQFSSVFSPLQM